ncbi:RNA polymerase sigma factor [Bacillus sp. CGMCC 1.16607]|uniref:RNA polymerase sigma factor n=1 Tax=Bacillus sp. CGMCC 1.16607 TaxID=3351842 RepID=UPI0036255E70
MNKDQELIKKIRSGDKESFSVLVKNLLPTAFKTSFLILKSKEHAEDAIQNALEGAYISIMKNKEITNFRAWFFSLVYSRSIDIYRKINRRIHNDIEHAEVQVTDSDPSAQQVVIQKENKAEVIGYIMKLKREQSLPLYLHYYENLTVKEVSLILGENENTVKTRMKRGKQQLAQIMKQSHILQEVKVNGI